MHQRRIFGPVLLALCAIASGAHAAEKDKIIRFPADTDTPVSFKLVAAQGKVGRKTPIYDNYRPQVRFSADRREVTCAVRIPKERQKIEPGETAEVALNCSEGFSVYETKRSFVAFEAGRKVGEGTVR